MRKQHHNQQFDSKRNTIIENLVNEGVYKINGKQLYELSLYELLKQYTMRIE
ncbi:Fur-regulated basic protein FbpA [Sporosarcina highlanderae]|uniref:Fur-regulated basic protein FbpA n=1 Tax=Sporosarcina highlanderae TaxID=3035916 RepID=A0ABT8JT65_9BACL|nr:Fur-regulated basic protein FbpA [Sporosarcina highlanderae]MDN4608360.1 Fur-regulated basic protein FbpA [Sporosarcina highlanderae]